MLSSTPPSSPPSPSAAPSSTPPSSTLPSSTLSSSTEPEQPLAVARDSAVALPPAFTRLAWSNLAAQSAEQIGLAAAPMVAVLAFSADAGATGWLQTAQTLPFLLLSIPAGVLADRVSRRGLMAIAEAVRAASLFAILLCASMGWLSLPVLALLGFIGASGTVAYGVAAPSLVPALVPRAALAAANGRLELARSAAFAAGPALAGVLVSWIGVRPAFATAALISCAAVALLSHLSDPPRPSRPARHPGRDLIEGASFVFTHAQLRPVLLTAFVFNTAWFMWQTMFVPYAVQRMGLSMSAVGATLAAYGVGMALTASIAPAVMRRLSFRRTILIGPFCGLAAALVMLSTLWWPRWELAAVSYLLIGGGPVLWTIASTTLRQMVTPDALLGRVSAINGTATYGARPLGAALGALVSMTWGAEACLAVAVAGFALQAAIIARATVGSAFGLRGSGLQASGSR